MIIKKIKVNSRKDIRISKEYVNGFSFIQLRIWEFKDNVYKPTQKYIALGSDNISELIHGLELTKFMESDINGHT
tara:strand:+ start:718 stop:942 length:225 start_codon:yes stop_codon:yes gene_type:complete